MLAVAGGMAALTGTIFGTPSPMIHVTWAEPPVPDLERQAIERQLGLLEPAPLSDREWSYVPADTSPDGIRRVVTHPQVADTAGVDRVRFVLRRPPLTPRRGGLLSAPPPGAARWWQATALGLGALAALLLTVVAARRSGRSVADVTRMARTAMRATMAVLHRAFTSPVLMPAGIVVLTMGFRVLSIDFLEDDHFTYLAYGYQTYLGHLPVRDYDDPGFPGMIALTALALKVGGASLLPDVLLGTGCLAAAAAITWFAARHASASAAWALYAALLQVIAFPRLYSYPKILMGALAALTFFAWSRSARSGRTHALVLAGLTAAGLLLRHDLAVYLGAASLTWLVATSPSRAVALRSVWRYVVACVVVATPYLVYLFAFGLVGHLQGAVSFSRTEAARTSDWAAEWMSRPPFSLALMALPVVVVGWLVVDRRVRGIWHAQSAAVAATVVMMATVSAVMLRDATPARVADVFGLAPVLVVWLGAEAWRVRSSLAHPLARAGVLALIVAAGVAFAVATSRTGQLEHQLSESRVLEGRDQVVAHAQRQITSLTEWPWTGALQGNLESVAHYLDRCTTPQQSLLVATYRPQLAMLARRPFAGGHAWLLPGYWVTGMEQQTMAARLAASPPAVIVLEPSVSGAVEAWPAIASLLSRYSEVHTIDALQLRLLPAARAVDAATGLPCPI
jgi:hypothetical protein